MIPIFLLYLMVIHMCYFPMLKETLLILELFLLLPTTINLFFESVMRSLFDKKNHQIDSIQDSKTYKESRTLDKFVRK